MSAGCPSHGLMEGPNTYALDAMLSLTKRAKVP